MQEDKNHPYNSNSGEEPISDILDLRKKQKDCEDYVGICQREYWHPAIKKFHKIRHFSRWALRLLVPDFLIGHPNLWDNLKTLRKNPQFKPVRMALTAWLIFTLVAGSAGIYTLLTASRSFASGESWLTDWSYRKKITIDHTTIGGSDLTDFPAPVEITADSDMSTALANGYDIRFTDSDGATVLSDYRESWSGGGGSAVTAKFWVKIPAISSSVDTDFYIYYGNASAPDVSSYSDTFTLPNTIIGNNLWLDAGQGITKDGSDYVSNWADQSGNLNDATQGTGANQPLWIADGGAGMNNKSVVRYVNTDYLNLASTITLNSSYTVFLVVNFYTTTIVGCVLGDDTHAVFLGATLGGYVNTIAAYNANTGYSTRVNGTAYMNIPTMVTITSLPDKRIYINGGEIAYTEQNDAPLILTTVGTRSPTYSYQYYTGDAAEIIIYNSALGTTDRQTVENYLAVKYGINAPSFSMTFGGQETGNNVPNTPTNSLPTDGATRQSIIPTLTSSAFSDPDPGDTHAASQWQITATSGNYTTPVYDSDEDAVNLISIAIPPSTLTYATTYYWHVKHKDNVGAWSSYSTETSFTTAAQPGTPTNSLPASGALNQKITPTLTSSAFSDPDPGSSHTASQWLIRSLTDPTYATPIYDSGEDASNLTSIAVPVGELSVNTTYFWKVRHKDDLGNWSSYSSETAFSTGVVPITVVAVGATEYTSGETAKLTVQVTDADGAPVNTATVTINVYNPSNTKLVNASAMTYITDSNGLYYYNYTIPATIGVYIYDVTASYSGLSGYSSHTFHVAQFASDVSSIKSTVESEQTAQIAERIAQDASRTKVTDIQTKITDVQSNLDILIGAFVVTQSSVNDASPSTTSFITALTNSTNDFYKNSVLTFTSGGLDGQVRRISSYNGTTKTITLDPALTSAPANGDTFTIVKQNVRVEEQATNIQNDVTYTRNKVDSVYALLETVDTNLSSVQTAVNSIRTSQQKAYKAELSDVSEIQTGNTYTAKLNLLDYEDDPVDAASLPIITIYDSTGAIMANAQNMTWDSTGVYSYSYDILSTDTTGLWEAVVTTAVGSSSDQTLNDYFGVTGSPAQVVINSITDATVPSISANVKITNEGSGDFEYHYEWCVVADQTNQCGGNDDVYYASASKLIQAGQDFITDLVSTVPAVGTYWFKLVVYYGTQASGASRQFTAVVSPVTVVASGSGPMIQTLTINALSAQMQSLQSSIDLESARMSRVLDALGIIKPIIVSGNKQLDNVKDVQNKLADLQAVSSSIKQIIESSSASPIVETYMKFNSVVISFFITNPASTRQTVNFKSFLPAEVKSEEIMDLDGLKLDYDTNANSYFVSGNISLGPKQSIAKSVEIKDIWVFDQSDLDLIKKQTESFAEALKNSQYNAQGILFKNDIESQIKKVEVSQKQSYSSPQDHILTYRNNKMIVEKANNNLDKLKDLVVQSGASQGLVGKIGGIQTFATWGIILAIVFGFGLLAVVIFAMWRHQMNLSMASMGLDKEILAELGRRKKNLKKKTTV